MTYLTKRPMSPPRRPKGLGDFFDVLTSATTGLNTGALKDFIEKKTEMSCLNEANASPSVMQMDAQVSDLAKNWNPTGYYTAADIQTVYDSTTKAIVGARAALLGAVLSTSDADQQIKQAGDYLNRSTERGLLYTQAIASARQSGTTAINAPGLKQWVLDTLNNVGQAYTTVAVLQCRSTWLDTAAAAINAVWNVVKRVIGIVIKAGDTVLKLADNALDLVPIIKWGALGVGALLVISWVRKRTA